MRQRNATQWKAPAALQRGGMIHAMSDAQSMSASCSAKGLASAARTHPYIIHLRACTHAGVHSHPCTHTHTHTHKLTHSPTHTHTHKHTHTHTHTHTHSHSLTHSLTHAHTRRHTRQFLLQEPRLHRSSSTVSRTPARRAQSRCRCGGTGSDVRSVPVQMWQGVSPVSLRPEPPMGRGGGGGVLRRSCGG